MKNTFMRPAPGDGSRLTARGRLMHRMATLAFTEATLYDVTGEACAHATGTFKYVKRQASVTTSARALNQPLSHISTD